MHKVASHYIFWRELYPQSYLVMEENTFKGVYPLEEEIAATEFYDGIIVPVLWNEKDKLDELIHLNNAEELKKELLNSGITNTLSIDDEVRLYQLHNGTIRMI